MPLYVGLDLGSQVASYFGGTTQAMALDRYKIQTGFSGAGVLWDSSTIYN